MHGQSPEGLEHPQTRAPGETKQPRKACIRVQDLRHMAKHWLGELIRSWICSGEGVGQSHLGYR